MFDNTAFVASLYAAFGRGDVPAILAVVDPAIDWVSNCAAGTVPWGGTRTGLTGATSFFQALGETMDFEVFEPGKFIDSGDSVAVTGRTRARHKHAGRGMFDCEWVHIFTIRDGKLTRFQEFYDTAAVERALAG